MSKFSRRDALRLPLALGLVAGLTGCDEEIAGWSEPSPTPTPTPLPSPTCAAQVRPYRIEEIGIELDTAIGCGKRPPRREQYLGTGPDPVPQWYFTDFVVYLLPDTFEADPGTPINGRHGFYRSVEQLIRGVRLDWDDGRTISYGKHVYSEYTNSRTDYEDHYAFVTPSRAPKPGHSTVTIRWKQLRLEQDAPERSLRALATSVRVI